MRIQSHQGASPVGHGPTLREELNFWFELDRDLRRARTVEERRGAALRARMSIAVHPEAHAMQTSVLLRAWPLLESPRLPPWRQVAMPAASRLAWGRLALLVEPWSFEAAPP